jgi:hypothetical protein
VAGVRVPTEVARCCTSELPHPPIPQLPAKARGPPANGLADCVLILFSSSQLVQRNHRYACQLGLHHKSVTLRAIFFHGRSSLLQAQGPGDLAVLAGSHRMLVHYAAFTVFKLIRQLRSLRTQSCCYWNSINSAKLSHFRPQIAGE